MSLEWPTPHRRMPMCLCPHSSGPLLSRGTRGVQDYSSLTDRLMASWLRNQVGGSTSRVGCYSAPPRGCSYSYRAGYRVGANIPSIPPDRRARREARGDTLDACPRAASTALPAPTSHESSLACARSERISVQVASRFAGSPSKPRADEGDANETADGGGGGSAVPKPPASGKASSNKVKVAVAAMEDAALHGEAGTERTFLLRSLCKALGAWAAPVCQCPPSPDPWAPMSNPMYYPPSP